MLFDRERHPHERRRMMVLIARLLHARQPDASAEWVRQLPRMARHLEEQLFRLAASFDEYRDATTVKRRLKRVALGMGLRPAEARRDDAGASSSSDSDYASRRRLGHTTAGAAARRAHAGAPASSSSSSSAAAGLAAADALSSPAALIRPGVLCGLIAARPAPMVHVDNNQCRERPRS